MEKTNWTPESGNKDIKKVKMRFPNESYFDEVTIDMNEFKPKNEFDSEVFGWYKNTYVSISKL